MAIIAMYIRFNIPNKITISIQSLDTLKPIKIQWHKNKIR